MITPPTRSSRDCSARTSVGSGTSVGTGVRDDEPQGTGEVDGRRGMPGEGTGWSGLAAGDSGPASGPAGEYDGSGGGEDDEPLDTGEAGHGRGAAGPVLATTTLVHQRAAACATRGPRLFSFNKSSALIRRTSMLCGVIIIT